MIPKRLHYCWFGRGKLPSLAEKCIASWKKFLPDYEIKEWNETNFDVNQIPYTAEAYKAKKYAFVSDYARFKILYKYGGLYFDTDVEIITSLDDILNAGAFMGLERNPITDVSKDSSLTSLQIAPGLGLAATPGLEIYKNILDIYESSHFTRIDGTNDLTTVVQRVTQFFLEKGLSIYPGIMDFEGIKIYPQDYFNPKPLGEKLRITDNTRTIHHSAASWFSPRRRLITWAEKSCGIWLARIIALVLRNPLRIPARIYKFIRSGE